jgi:long-chain-fatty-acid--[acyl-carrier-protein] ligase
MIRTVLRLRYSTTLRGFDEAARRRGWLILANHPAEMDPVLLSTITWQRFRMRSLVLDEFYRTSFGYPILRLSRALPIPDLERERSRDAVATLRRRLDEAVAALRQGDNILLYPSGRLYREPREVIGNASGTHLLLKRLPDVPVLLVRIRGFWGSSFSCAAGSKPDMGRALLRGVACLLRNGLLWCPRRPVLIECEAAPPDFPRHASRQELNQWLESWFNRPGDEPLVQVPYSRWARGAGMQDSERQTGVQHNDPVVLHADRHPQIGRHDADAQNAVPV